jgi:hypothetical protein
MELLFFIIFFLMTSTAIYLKRIYFDYLRDNASINQHINSTNSTVEKICVNITSKSAYILDDCACIYLYPIDPNVYVSHTDTHRIIYMNFLFRFVTQSSFWC